MNEHWRATWQRTRNHEGVIRGAQALVALGCVLALGWQADWQDEIMPSILGVIACAFTEIDDSWRGRLQTLWLATVSFVLVMAAVWWALPYPVVLALVIACAATVLTLLGALGPRYQAIAFGAVVLSIYTALLAHNHRDRAWELAPYLIGGSIWYGLVSALWAALWPKAIMRHRLSQVYALLGEYLQLKAQLLEPVQDVDQAQRRLALALHNGRMVEALNAAKESLFNRLGHRRHNTAPAWLHEAMHQYLAAQDIHERVSSSHESYVHLSDTFARSDVLYRFQRVISVMGTQAQKLAQAIRDRTHVQHEGSTVRALQDMRAAIAHLEQHADTVSRRSLRAVQALGNNLSQLATVLAHVLRPSGQTPLDFNLFDHQIQNMEQAWQRVRQQLHAESVLTRHALRLGLMLLIACAVMHITQDPHGYWIVLTVLFGSQPQFAATLQRLQLRAWGTALGLAIGWALIRLFPTPLWQASCMVLAGAVFIGKRATDPRLATAAVSCLVLLSFHQMGMAQGVIPARLLDTGIGTVIVACGAWLIFPTWQARHWPQLVAQSLRSQAAYLRAILEQYATGEQADHLGYRLARRNAHNADAALSNAFAAMRKEPTRKQRNLTNSAQMLVLTHTMLNYISALGAHRGEATAGVLDSESCRLGAQLEQSLQHLAMALEQPLHPTSPPPAMTSDETPDRCSDDGAPNDRLLQAQLRLADQLLPVLKRVIITSSTEHHTAH